MTRKLRMPPKRRLVLLIPALLSAAAVLTTGCSRPKAAEDVPPAEERATPGYLTLPPEQLAHIKTTVVKRTAWSLTVRTTGTVDWNADRTSPVITQVSGPIARIVADTGSAVSAGSPLIYVSSPDVTTAVSAYRKAVNRLDFAKRSLDRARDLLDHQAIARKDFESAQADYNDAGTEVENDLAALRILGVTKEQIDAAERQGTSIDPELVVRSPIAGVIVQKLVSPGQLIQAGSTTCFLVSDVSNVWTQAHIFEKDLASIGVNDPAEETNSSFKQVFHGTVTYIGAMVDAATRTTPVRIVTANPGGLLKKDMLVDTVIHTSTRRSVLAVPASAVLHDADNQPFVYVEVEAGKFAQRQVTVGPQLDDEIEILGGCKEGEKVVSEGGVFLQFALSNQ